MMEADEWENHCILERYARQIIIPEIGVTGQEILGSAHVLVAGVGGLGSFSSLYLASMGVGHLTLIDNGFIALSDLNRQVLYDMDVIGQPKVHAAEVKLREFNPNILFTTVFGEITAESLSNHLDGVDAVVDATDNFRTRKILNSVCYRRSVPLIFGGVSGLRGAVTTVLPNRTPCLECLLPKEEPNEPIPVLSPIIGLVAAIQVMEVVKLILGRKGILCGAILQVDLRRLRFSKLKLKVQEDCPVCHGGWEELG